MMDGPIWVDRGRPVTKILPAEMPRDPDVTFRLFGLARCSAATIMGRHHTVIEWDLENCHADCLDFIIDEIVSGRLSAPYVLRVYRLGWFSEVHDASHNAAFRISELKALRSVEAFPGLKYVSSERDPAQTAHAINLIQAGALSDRLVVSSVPGDGTAPLIVVGRNSMLAQIAGRDWAQSNPSTMDGRFKDVDPDVLTSFENTLDRGKPALHETWALVNEPDGKEPWWLRVHRLLIPFRKNVVASYCFQGMLPSSLQTTFFGHPGREFSVAARV